MGYERRFICLMFSKSAAPIIAQKKKTMILKKPKIMRRITTSGSILVIKSAILIKETVDKKGKVDRIKRLSPSIEM